MRDLARGGSILCLRRACCWHISFFWFWFFFVQRIKTSTSDWVSWLPDRLIYNQGASTNNDATACKCFYFPFVWLTVLNGWNCITDCGSPLYVFLYYFFLPHSREGLAWRLLIFRLTRQLKSSDLCWRKWGDFHSIHANLEIRHPNN